MKTSQNGINFIKTWECGGDTPLLKATRLSGEPYYTIGFGHYGADVAPGATITRAEAEQLLRADLLSFEKAVTETCSKYARFLPNQNQFDALVSFAYNLGPENLKRLVNGRSAGEAAAHMTAYTGSYNEAFREGLTRRRRAEQALFNQPIEKKEATVMATKTGTGDNPGKDYKTATEWAKAAGIFRGDGKGNYDWQGTMTREQVAMVLYNFCKNNV